MNEYAANTIELNECAELEAQSVQSLSIVMDQRKITGEKRQSIERVSRFIQHIWQNENKSIVDVPCGGGKSLWSLALIHAHEQRSHQYPEQNSLLLVVDTLKTGQERLDALMALGIRRDYIGFYHSFWDEECNRLRAGSGYDYQQIVTNRNCCKDCPVRASCGFHNRSMEYHRPVVIITHEGFIRLLECNRIAPDRDIIIDEEPNPYYMAKFERKEVQRLCEMLNSIQHHSCELSTIVETVEELRRFTSETKHLRSSLRWTQHITNRDKLAAYRFLKQEFSKCGGDTSTSASSNDPWEEDFLREHHLTLLGDLGYALRDGAETFVYADKAHISIARRRMDLGISNKVLLLNGSASLYRYSLGNDMQVFTCPELKPEYPNVVLHCIESLPTKRRLKNREFVMRYVNFARTSLNNRMVSFIAINKRKADANNQGAQEADDSGIEEWSAEAEIRAAFPSITDDGVGERGTIIGSNRWIESEGGIIGMSLFTDIAHYALHASLRHNREIHADEMFLNREGRYSLKVSSNRHLSPPEVDDEFRREAAHELYQTIMRMRCRQDSGANVDVVVILPHMEILSDLERLMPNIKVKGGEDGSLEFLWEILHSQRPVSNDDFFKAIGLNPTSGRNIKRGREIGLHFGIEPQQTSSHRVRWVRNDIAGRN